MITVFTPYVEDGKPKIAMQHIALKSVRKTWGFKPTSRVLPDKTKFSRKNKFKKGLDGAE